MQEESTHIEIRNLTAGDYENLKSSMLEAYSNWPGDSWRQEHIHRLLEIFPRGQIAVAVNGKVVGCALSLIIKYDIFGEDHTYKEITGGYTFDTHSPYGDVLYGIDVFITPEYRGMKLARRLYDARKELCEDLNLRAIVFGGRIPNFYKQSNSMTPKEYIQKVRQKELYDPVLTFQMANDFHVKKVLKGYSPGDEESKDYAVLLQWDNIYYEKYRKEILSNKSTVRLGLIQWQMRLYKDLDDFIQQAEYFIDAVSSYKCDFALLPEFFNAPLMAAHNDLPPEKAIREIARYTDEIRSRFSELSISYNVNIITGSVPCIENEKLLNVGFLCRRNGTYERYEKIHISPSELKYWGFSGGNLIKSFDTDCGKIGVLICYDIQFPEQSRLLAEEGAKILFVPFLTDTQNAYSRVRHCAQARAIENECFVAIAGSVGNLPKVENMDIQFAQSVVFTPCDFAFPSNGITAEATPNTEMVLIVDVDLDLLKELHSYGSVRNLKDRRLDLYDLRLK
ncbi:MAG: bifunctional GNAT family N-acetyltransferase/carbon-nitrogen hydrolase family protein [Leptospiraceae bacterium]|nr:bifunctional GNAT family N-acetyltransferase/carbon-nitrogen hydrolase family protein [Leptospiraceae bacterium]MCP5513703.1 bifunctional GNAT family N-acetyltransferase/carbon-nitrogen hydrolase family protein [Leptospiraceae bacterium]